MNIMRNRDFFLVTVILASAAPVCSQSEVGAVQINTIVQFVKTGNVGRVEVFGVPPDALFRANVTPERLDSLWDYKLTVRSLDARLEPRAEELTIALRSAAIQPSTAKLDSLDVRWGIVFYSKTPEGKRFASFYFDRSGRNGAVDNIPAYFGPDLLPRLKKALHAHIE
jgi:hypothetical protein